MKIQQKKYSKTGGWKIVRNDGFDPALCNLVLVFSSTGVLTDESIYASIKKDYGNKTAIAGFYSYGEIAPSFNFLKCELHNQTMTITTLTEE